MPSGDGDPPAKLAPNACARGIAATSLLEALFLFRAQFVEDIECGLNVPLD